MHIDPGTFGEWLRDGKVALDLLRSAIGLLPKGKQQEELSVLIAKTDEALKRSEAAAAKDFGFPLCKCEFPPPIMLWHEKEEAYVCPRPSCGHRISRVQVGRRVTRGSSGGGPQSWMG